METTYRYSENEYVAIGDAARIVGLSISTLRRYIASGRLSPGRTPGGHYRFLVADLRSVVKDAEAAA